jgi:hypothetical protein
VLGPGPSTVTATAVFEDDTTTVLPDNSPQIWAPDTNVDATGQVPGFGVPAGIDHVSCVIVDGTNDEPADSCIEAPGDPLNAGPVGCDFPIQAGQACVQYGDANADADTVSGNMTVVVDIAIECTENTAVPITASQPSDAGPSQDVDWVFCLVDPNFTLEKVFEGDPPDQAFQFTYNGPGCLLSIDPPGGAPTAIADGEPFSLMNGQTANFFCGPGTHTVSEVDVDIATLSCDGTGPAGFSFDADAEAGTIEVTFPEEDASGDLPCVMTNTGIETSTVTVEKVCVDAEELEGTFSVALDDGEPVELACGDSTTFEDVAAGPHTLTETIDGDDAEDFETVIICGDGVIQEGTTADLEVVAGEDQLCLVINGADLTDLICDECPCGCGDDIEIDIDNNNNNTIGIDNSNTNNNANNNTNDNDNKNENKNENNNENKNEQNQTNDQNQDNSNTQTNNITSSPEVNIDFDD